MTEAELADLARRNYADAIEERLHSSAAVGRAVAAVAHAAGWDASTARQFVLRALREK